MAAPEVGSGSPVDRSAASVRRAAQVAGWELKTLAAAHPWAAIPLARLRGHGEIVRADTDVVIEAFARSAQTFVVAAFRLAQEPRQMRIAHHTHSPSTLIDGVRHGVPALAIVRAPRDAVISLIIRRPELTMGGSLRGYVRFYRPLVPHLDRLAVATFEQVTSDLASAIGRLNERCGSAFAPFEPTAANVERVFSEIEADERRRATTPEERERAISRPSSVRERLKAGLLAAYGDERHGSIRTHAERLYATMASAAGARTDAADATS